LLKRVWDEVRKEGFLLGNLDITVLAEAPKVSPHVAAMKNSIAAAIDSDISQIAIKATTMERLGFVGRREGIAAMAVALLVAE
jgi:2-C-methyl-D-erythritol 2,4-cyclodiphosphate synthase